MMKNTLDKTHREAHHTTKAIKVMVMLTFFTLVLIGGVSAFEFDNVLRYSNNDLDVRVVNAFGLGATIGTAELKSHKSVDEILNFGFGEKEIVMYYDFTGWVENVGGLGEIEFTDIKTGKTIQKDYSFVEWKEVDIPNYVYDCSNNFYPNGTLIIEECEKRQDGTLKEFQWVNLTDNNIKNSRIGLKTYVGRNDFIDAVWTIEGKKVKKHAQWTGAGNIDEKTTNYYKLDDNDLTDSKFESNGTNGGTTNIPGKINTARFFDGVSDDISFQNNTDYTPSIYYSLWATTNATGCGDVDCMIFWRSGDPSLDLAEYVSFVGTEVEFVFGGAGGSNNRFKTSGAGMVADQFYHIVITGSGIGGNGRYAIFINGTNQTVNFASVGGNRNRPTGASHFNLGNRIDGNVGFLEGIVDEVAIGNETLSQDEVDYLFNDFEGCPFLSNDNCNFIGTPTVTLDFPEDNKNFTINNVTFNATIFDDTNITNVTLYIDDLVNSTNTTAGLNNTLWTFSVVGFAEGNTDWTMEACNFDNLCINASGRTFTIDTTNPNITLTAPPLIVSSIVLNTNLSVNWTIVELNPDTCTLEYEGVNVTVTCGDLDTEINITNSVNRTVIIYMNDTFGNTNSDSRTWEYNFIETGQEFTTDVFETNNYSFAINVTTTQSVSSFTAFLNHNETIHSADSICTSGDCEITTVIDIPLLNSEQSTENKTFFWQLSIFNGTGTTEINTSTQTQNVTAINFEACGTTTQTVNFTTHRESDRSVLATTFAATFESYLGTGSVKKISNFSGSGDNGYEFCIDQNETFIVNSKIDLSAENFSSRHYDFVKDEFVNVSFDRQLFLVNSSVATTIIIEVKDQGLIPQENIIVNISRFYAAIGQFVQIENQITDEFGQIVAKLVQNDAKYRFNFLTIDNLLLKTSEDITIACRSLICIIPFVLEDTTDEFERFENLTTYTSTLTFDNSTNLFTFTWADQRGESPVTTRLEVTRYQLNGSSIVCNVSSTSILSTLSCDVGGESASYKAQSFRTTSEDIRRRISVLNVKVNDLVQIYGLEGLMWVFLLLFTALGIGAFNPTVGAILYLTGFIIMGVLSIISMPPEVFFANIVLTIIFIWAVNKR